MKIDFGRIVSAGAIVVLSIVLAACSLIERDRTVQEPIKIIPPEPTGTAPPTETPAPMLVYVSGEVLYPDVYTLAPDNRIKQLVEAAGGFTDEADPAAVNLAQPLVDGAHVHVPAKGESLSPLSGSLSTLVPQQRSVEIDLEFGGDLVNINTAGLQELETLPGIGPVMAQRILDYRTVNGPFQRIEAIMEVYGIGQAKFDMIKEQITTGS